VLAPQTSRSRTPPAIAMRVLRALLKLGRRDRRVHVDSFSSVVAVDAPTKDVPDEVRASPWHLRARSKSTPLTVCRESPLALEVAELVSDPQRHDAQAGGNAWEGAGSAQPNVLQHGAAVTAAAANTQVTRQLREMRRGRVEGYSVASGSGVMALQRMTDEAIIDGFLMTVGDRRMRP